MRKKSCKQLFAELTREYLVSQLPVTVLNAGLEDVPPGLRLRLPPQPLLDLVPVLRVAIDRLGHQEHNPHTRHILTKR